MDLTLNCAHEGDPSVWNLLTEESFVKYCRAPKQFFDQHYDKLSEIKQNDIVIIQMKSGNVYFQRTDGGNEFIFDSVKWTSSLVTFVADALGLDVSQLHMDLGVPEDNLNANFVNRRIRNKVNIREAREACRLLEISFIELAQALSSVTASSEVCLNTLSKIPFEISEQTEMIRKANWDIQVVNVRSKELLRKLKETHRNLEMSTRLTETSIEIMKLSSVDIFVHVAEQVQDFVENYVQILQSDISKEEAQELTSKATKIINHLKLVSPKEEIVGEEFSQKATDFVACLELVVSNDTD